MSDAEDAKAFQAIDKDGAAKRRDLLLPRFAAYASFDREVSVWGSDWLESEAGAACWLGTIKGVTVAVVGVNTAWLCQDDKDWGKLTPGRYMLERMVDEAQARKPDILIVLGHHPLDALSVEGEPKDGPHVKERLKQANALYLHGHLHASGNDRIGDTLRSTLTIQAPSGFQAHDDKRWRNGLMWGELDPARHSVLIEPRLWNEKLREYKPDSDAGYESERVEGRDAFWVKRPTDVFPNPPSATEPTKPEPSNLPTGWRKLDRAALMAIRSRPPARGAMVAFFDGSLPTWELALASGVRSRAVVTRVADRLRAVHPGAPKPLVLLLAGAGGEGKSTAVLQAAASLVEDAAQNWTCLHRHAAAAAVPEDLLANLRQQDGHAWVAVIDDADNVAHLIIAALLRLQPRTDVHLLLAAREADWRLKKVVPGFWEDVAQFQQVTLAGLDEADARGIVAGWRVWGEEAMGKLGSIAEERAATILLNNAHDFAARKEEGALLGALLATRHGDDIRGHVRTLLHGLGRNPVVGRFSLRQVYAMVAAMHAENQLYLSRSVLAFALGSDQGVLERHVLDVLRQEAMLDPGDRYLMTRHRRIAEAACSVLLEDGDDVDDWYPFLARAAGREFIRTRDTTDIAAWTFRLAEHFEDKGERWWPLARSVAKAVYEVEPNNGHRVTAYARILRRTGWAPEAMEVLKATGERFKHRSGVLYEWGTVAGATDDQGLAAWLAGRSLADGGTLSEKDCKLALAGLGVAFRELFAASGNPAFAAAQAACGQLGLRLPELDPKNTSHLGKHVAEGRRNGTADLTPEQAVAAIRKGVIRGAENALPENDPASFENLLGDPESYRYTSLSRLVSGGAKQVADRQGAAGRDRAR